MWYAVQIDVKSSSADRVIDVTTQVGVAVAVEIILGKHDLQSKQLFSM
jgi:hypothetical protein